MKAETLTREQVLERVRQVAAQHTNVDAGSIAADSDFHADLGFDSLDDVEFVMSLEDEFDISVADEDATRAKTVGTAAELVWRSLESG